MVKALDEVDREGKLVGRIERARATRQAAEDFQEWLARGDRTASEGFFQARAEKILGLLPADSPVRRFAGGAHGLGGYRFWMAILAIILMLVVGLVFSPVDTRTINILHFPLYGLILWNLIIYLGLLICNGLRIAGLETGVLCPLRINLAQWEGKLSLPLRWWRGGGGNKDEEPLPLSAQVLQKATGEWVRRGRPLHAARLGIWLHLMAAAILGGMLAGMYLTGLGKEFRVTWESTFLSAEQVHGLFAILFAPLNWLGITLPSAAEIAEAQAPGSENAARWIFLLSAAGLVYVIIPRLLLAVAAGLKTLQLRRNFPLEWQDDPYFENLLNRPARHEEKGATLVLPHSLKLEERERQTLRLLFNDSFGSRMNVEFADAVEYGFEEEVAAQLQQAGRTTMHNLVVLLFRLSATPEGEVQGQLLTTVQQEARHNRLARRMLVLIDNSGFRERLGGADSETAQSRIAQRRQAWEDLCAGQDVTPVFVDLDAEDPQVMGNVVEDVRNAAWEP